MKQHKTITVDGVEYSYSIAPKQEAVSVWMNGKLWFYHAFHSPSKITTDVIEKLIRNF